jgi:hypothetical protein
MYFSEKELEALRLLVWDWMSYAQAQAEGEGTAHPLLAAFDRLNDFLDAQDDDPLRREFLTKILGNYLWKMDPH